MSHTQTHRSQEEKSTLSLAQALEHARTDYQIESLDASMLLLHAMGRERHDRAHLSAHADDTLGNKALSQFQAYCQRRALGEPTAYIIGRQEFWGLDLEVNSATLIPRADTETLVEWALEPEITQTPEVARSCPLRVLDLGTGSGAIALALQKERPNWRIDACDINADALNIARENAQRLGLPLLFQQSHWFAQLEPALYELIVSNPPYIADQDPHLAALSHEPSQALTSGADGLQDIREIVEIAPAFLRPHAWLLLEHGFTQGEAVARLLRAQGFSSVTHRHDLAGHVRCTGGQWRG